MSVTFVARNTARQPTVLERCIDIRQRVFGEELNINVSSLYDDEDDASAKHTWHFCLIQQQTNEIKRKQEIYNQKQRDPFCSNKESRFQKIRREHETLIGTFRIRRSHAGSFLLEHLCILPEYRKQGASYTMLEAVDEFMQIKAKQIDWKIECKATVTEESQLLKILEDNGWSKSMSTSYNPLAKNPSASLSYVMVKEYNSPT